MFGCRQSILPQHDTDSEGNRTPKRQPGPVVFTLVSKPHPVFSRRGYDLVHKVTIPLYQGLIGTPIDVPMLDGRLLSVPLTKIVTPGFKHVVEGEGMPKPDGSKGSLVLEVDLLFPDTVTETQKMLLKAAFFLPHRPSLVQQKAIKGFEDAFKNELLGWRSGFPKQEEAAAEGGASK